VECEAFLCPVQAGREPAQLHLGQESTAGGRSDRKGERTRQAPKKETAFTWPGMMVHQDGSAHQWVSRVKWDLIVTMDDVTNEHYSMFFVEEKGPHSASMAMQSVKGSKFRFSSIESFSSRRMRMVLWACSRTSPGQWVTRSSVVTVLLPNFSRSIIGSTIDGRILNEKVSWAELTCQLLPLRNDSELITLSSFPGPAPCGWTGWRRVG